MARQTRHGLAILGLVELALSFTFIYQMINIYKLTGATPGLPITFGSGLTGNGLAFAALMALSTGAIGLTIGLYQPDACLNRKSLPRTLGIAAVLAFVVLLLVAAVAGVNFTTAHALRIARLYAAWLLAISLIRLTYSLGPVRSLLTHRVIVLGDPARIDSFNKRLQSRRGRRFESVTARPGELCWKSLSSSRIWGVVITSPTDEKTTAALLECKLRGLAVLGESAFQDRFLGRTDLDSLSADALLLAGVFPGGRVAAVVKRASDVVLALVLLVLTLPLMAAAAIAIKLDSRGPVLYRQTRIGRFGKPFTLFKFRSMLSDAEAGGKPRWAQKHDPRITRVGRFIRDVRIDELPQLANILSGHMSLVGPRPERPHFVEQLAEVIPFYRQRACVKPGLTGWAQVNFPYGASVEDAREKLAYDLYYVQHRSLLLDLTILLSTVRVVLSRDGAR